MRFLVAVALTALIAGPSVAADRDTERIVTRHVASIVPPDGAGGVAVALRIEGRSLFFSYGSADRTSNRPITTDPLFNLASLRKVFEATLLAQAVRNGDLRLDDPVAKYVVELQQGGDIRQVTLRQLATHTSGLLLQQDHPPWPDWGYTLSEFVRTLNGWKADKAQSAANQSPSLLTGNLTGNFADSGWQQRFSRLINGPTQRLAAEFPTEWEQGMFAAITANFFG